MVDEEANFRHAEELEGLASQGVALYDDAESAAGTPFHWWPSALECA